MHRPGDVAKQLHVSANTLRLWSTNFSDYLSPSAQAAKTEKGGAAQRRYTDEDVQVLTRAKGLLASGKTYEDVAVLLSQPPSDDELAPSQAVAIPDSQPSTQAIDLSPMVAIMSQQMQALDEHIRQDRDRNKLLAAEITTLRTQFSEVNQKLERMVHAQERMLELASREPVPWWQRLRDAISGVSSKE